MHPSPGFNPRTSPSVLATPNSDQPNDRGSPHYIAGLVRRQLKAITHTNGPEGGNTHTLHRRFPMKSNGPGRLPRLNTSLLACAFVLLAGAHASAQTDTGRIAGVVRSEEHTSELQSRQYLVCRLLLEKKKKKNPLITYKY